MIEPEEDLSDYSKDEESAGLLEMRVPMEHGGLRLDQALVRLFPEYSRSRLQDWVEQGLVTVNGNEASVKQKVWGGEAIRVSPQTHPSEQPYYAEDIPLDIVYEDDAILVINKPVGLVVHPGSGNWQGTLLNALLHHAPQLAEVPRAGIVHRLDKDTSGLLVVAKTLVAQTALVRQLQERTMKREYLALVWGELDYGDVVDLPVGRHPSQRVKMAVIEGGKEAITHYSVEANFPSCTLVRCRLETGRTHQIRVHMTHIGIPDRRQRTRKVCRSAHCRCANVQRFSASGVTRRQIGFGAPADRRMDGMGSVIARGYGRTAGQDRRGERWDCLNIA